MRDGSCGVRDGGHPSVRRLKRVNVSVRRLIVVMVGDVGNPMILYVIVGTHIFEV